MLDLSNAPPRLQHFNGGDAVAAARMLGVKRTAKFISKLVTMGRSVEGMPYTVREKYHHGMVVQSGTIVQAIPVGLRLRKSSVIGQWQLTIRLNNGDIRIFTVEKLPRRNQIDTQWLNKLIGHGE